MARSLEIALAFGFPIVEITRDMFGYDHSLIGLAQDNGKPGFVCEVKAQQRYFRSSIPAGVRGILNVMKCIGMIDGEIEPQSDITGTGATVRFVDFRPMRSGLVTFTVTGGQFVDRGERLGTVRDLWGNVVDEIRSPTSGYIRTVTDNQAVYAGQIVGTILEPHARETLWTRAWKT
jgi:predicted deacylase